MAPTAPQSSASWRRSQVYVILFALFCQSVVVGYLAVELKLKASRRAIHSDETTVLNDCGSEVYSERLWMRMRRSFAFDVEDTSCYLDTNMIPVMGVTVLHDPHFFFSRFIYSIDFPVAHLVVVYNADDPDVSRQVLTAVNQTANMTLIPQHGHFGVAEGWNLITQQFPNEPWYLIASYDVAFIRGQLRKFASTFVRDDATEQASMRPINSKTDFHNPCGLGAYNIIAIKQRLIQRAGYFDENIYPAYFEDDEWNIRLQRLDPPGIRTCYPDIFYVHGRRTDIKHVTGILRLGDSVAAQVLSTKSINWDYVAQKWGCELVGNQRSGMHPVNCSFTNPFNNPQLPVSHWSLDRRRRRDIQNVMAAWAAQKAAADAAAAAAAGAAASPAGACPPCAQGIAGAGPLPVADAPQQQQAAVQQAAAQQGTPQPVAVQQQQQQQQQQQLPQQQQPQQQQQQLPQQQQEQLPQQQQEQLPQQQQEQLPPQQQQQQQLPQQQQQQQLPLPQQQQQQQQPQQQQPQQQSQQQPVQLEQQQAATEQAAVTHASAAVGNTAVVR